MSRLAFALALALVVLAALAYPLQQALGTGGFVYYTNGNDEATYLQYDYARTTISPTRPGQLPVVWAHQLGMPGGWQNLCFDAATLLGFTLALVWIFRRLGWSAPGARLAGLALLTVPLLVSAVNPLVHSLSFRNVQWGTVFWLNMAEQTTPALLRTPEPQVSWLLALAALAVALRLRSAWPLLLATPVMYPFVGVPVAFTALAWELRRLNGRPGWALVGAYAALGLAMAAYTHGVAGERLRLMLVASHLPLLSLSAVLALGGYALLRARIAPEHRFVALAAALAPLAACNLQLISGIIAQPDDYEQFTGIFAVGLVLVLGLKPEGPVLRGLVAAGCALFVWSSVGSFRENAQVNGRVPLDARLLTALREHPRQVAVNNLALASVLDMVYARQATTALGYDQAFAVIGDRYIGSYRCARRQILATHPDDPGFRRALFFLDKAYTYGSQDYVMANIGRKDRFTRLQDVEAGGCAPADDPPLDYFVGPSAWTDGALPRHHSPSQIASASRLSASPAPTAGGR